jgi:uncharacterized protein YciI
MRHILLLIVLVCGSSLLTIAQDKQTEKKKQNYIVVLHLTEKYKNEKNWDDSASARVTRHFNNLKRMRDEGTLYLAGRTNYEDNDPKLFGIYVFTAASMDAAKEIMNNDPAVSNGIMTAEVHPFSLALIKN